MSDKQFAKFLSLLFSDGYIELYNVIGDDGIRKAGIRSTKVKEYPNGDVDYKITINKNILGRYLGGEE